MIEEIQDFVQEKYEDKRNTRIAAFGEENKKEEIQDSSNKDEELNQLFNDLNEFTDLVNSDQYTDESIDVCKNIFNEISTLVDQFKEPEPEQFVFLFHLLWILSNQDDLKDLKNQLIYVINQIIRIYPDFIEHFLNSDEVSDYTNIFSGIFLNYDELLLSNLITKSERALEVFLSNDLVDKIFNGINLTVSQIFPDFNAEQKIDNNYLAINQQSNKLLFNYWINALKILEKISNLYTSDTNVQEEIFNFCIRFLNQKFYKISAGFFFKVVDCISSCIKQFDSLEMFDFDKYHDFLIETLFGQTKQIRESIFNLFNVMSKPPFCLQWEQGTLSSICDHVIEWYNSKDYQNYIQYFSLFLDFISNVISYQPDTFDTLNEISFFDEIFAVFEGESLKIKLHIIDLFVNLTDGQIWPKAVTFYCEHEIVTELFLSLSSVHNDVENLLKIIDCLTRISSENFLTAVPEFTESLVDEFQGELASNALSTFDDEDDENGEEDQNNVGEMIQNLRAQIESLTEDEKLLFLLS